MNASSHHIPVTSMLCVLIQSDHTHVDATKDFRDAERGEIVKVRANVCGELCDYIERDDENDDDDDVVVVVLLLLLLLLLLLVCCCCSFCCCR